MARSALPYALLLSLPETDRKLTKRSGSLTSNSQFVHCDLVQGIEIAIAIGIGVDFIIDPGDFDPDFDPDPGEPSRIENCC